VDEFALIDEIVAGLGDRAEGRWIALGPGDDAAVIDQRPGQQTVASIDTLLADVHFPANAPAQLIGFRSLMVALSDLAAMAAEPRYVLVALTLPQVDVDWVRGLTQGMAQAALACDTYLCGGNLSRGPLSISISVHGEVPAGGAIVRSGARVGDSLYVSGPLGGAAACVRTGDFSPAAGLADLPPHQAAYYRPSARFDCIDVLRQHASAAIDISDGLMQDLAHIAKSSGVAVNLNTAAIPRPAGATLPDALVGGDDYQIAATAATPMAGFVHIGEVVDWQESAPRVNLDDANLTSELASGGYKHFS